MNNLRILGFLCLSCCIHLQAQNLVRYKFRHISPQSGLSSTYTRKIIQDPYGFMWIGTQDGLNRYDGKNFVLYNKGRDRRHALAGSDIQDLALDSAERLIWEISSYGGIDAIDYATGDPGYHYFQDRDPSTEATLFSSMALLGHRLYIGSTRDLFVLDTREKKLQRLSLPVSFQTDSGGLSIDKLQADAAGRIWLFCRGHGVLLLRGSDAALLDSVNDTSLKEISGPGVRFFDNTPLPDGRILSATSAGLKIFSADATNRIRVNRDPYPQVPFSRDRAIYSCRQDKKGSLWFCASNYLVKIDPGGSFIRIRENTSRDEFNWIHATYYIYFDQEDDCWLGCQKGVAYTQNQPSCFASIGHSSLSMESIQQAYFIDPVNDSLLYSCAQEGLYRVNPATGAIRALDTSRPFYHVFADPQDRLIASCIDGVFCIDKGKFIPLEKIYPEFKPLHRLLFNNHCYIGDSVIIFGTENDRGVVVWNYRTHKARTIDRHTSGIWLRENTINALYKDRDQRVWIMGDRSVAILDYPNHRIQQLNTYDTALNKFYSIFFDLCQVRDRYYLASYGNGVLILDREYRMVGLLSVKDGLADNGVYKIIPYRDSLLFVTTNKGLSVVNIRDRNHIKNYYESDGLHSDNFEENSGTGKNDLLYAGGAGGLTVIDPSLLPASSPPPRLYLQEVKIETGSGLIDTSNLLLKRLEIPNNNLQTTLYFSSLNYPNPERSAYMYRIKERGDEWVHLGGQDFVNLIGQNPGTYTLQVRSANEDSVWNKDTLECTLVFLPRWYQTLWFKMLVIGIILALLYCLYRYRISQLQQQQQIRKDIASDLHDDIGSILNTVKIFTHLAKKERNREEHLSRIEESLAEASMGLRDMIWVLDDSGDTIRELSDRIRKFAIPVTSANDIAFECLVEEGLYDETISKTAKRNLLLIAKESVNNSIKYANGRHIFVSIQKEEGRLSLSIRDDGKGFDPRERGKGRDGNGLKNIIERARQIHFEATIHSAPGEGTLIEIRAL